MTTVKRWAAAGSLAVLAGAAAAEAPADVRALLSSRIASLDARVAQGQGDRAHEAARPPDAARLRLSMASRHLRQARRFLAKDDERAARLHLDLAERLLPPTRPAEGSR